jgi:hypothetical protein
MAQNIMPVHNEPSDEKVGLNQGSASFLALFAATKMFRVARRADRYANESAHWLQNWIDR